VQAQAGKPHVQFFYCSTSEGHVQWLSTSSQESGRGECRAEHSAKSLTWGPSLAGSLPSVPSGTRQRWILLPSAAGQTLGKDNSFAECHQGHSAKPPSPSPGAVTAAFLCRVLSGTRQTSLPSAREKALGKEGFADALFAEPSLPSVFEASPSASGTRQSD
jgi:hypothetical protein